MQWEPWGLRDAFSLDERPTFRGRRER
jgi:hypothetical protein